MRETDHLRLMNIHIQALYTLDAERRLLLVNEAGNTSPAPRLFLGRTREGNVWRFRAGLPDKVVDELDAICRDEPIGFEWGSSPLRADELLRVLESHSPVDGIESGPAYCFGQIVEPGIHLHEINEQTADLLRNGFEEMLEEVPTAQPFFAAVEGGRAVSLCRSVRITPQAHEAGVETLPEYRGKGLAAEVVLTWARAVASAGALPMYSTSWENKPSQAVARKLNLTVYGADFHVG